jgi:diacylglycerol kinase (ATP)
LRIGLLSNLRAGRSGKLVSRLLSFLKSHRDVISVETDQAGAVPEALAELARQEVELLVVNGGDGTLQHTLTEILGNRAFNGRIPLVAPLRGGRTNMSALDLGAHRDPRKGLAAIIEATKNGTLETRLAPRRVLRVAYGLRGDALYGMFFGGGIVYRGIELTHRMFPPERSQGVFGATLVTASLLGRTAWGDHEGIMTPNKAQILLDDELVPQGEFSLLISTSLGRLFANMRPFWGTGPGGVRFTAMVSGAHRMGAAFPGMLRGKPASFVTPENGYISRNLKRVKMRLDCGFTVDGELVPGSPGRILAITADDRLRFLRA